MRHVTRSLLAALMALMISACSPDEPAQEKNGALPEDNVFSDQVKTLQRAKDVQQTLDAGVARQRDEIERQERP
jgi:outer membrane biogenesis lipoprotein LolB